MIHCLNEKHWRLIVEGALLECRSGSVDNARTLLKSLRQSGPVVLELCRLEEREGNHVQALRLCERALVSRYTPMWF